MDLTSVLTVFAIVATNLITVITLYIHSDNKAQSLLNAIRSDVNAIHTEMKDFHGRLVAIEERSKPRIQ
jgi:hypothetical protein